MNIPILSGIYTSMAGDFKSSYPMNLIPVPKQSGVSDSYLKTADGIVRFDTGNLVGVDRGGINWNGVLYRVVGTKLVRIAESGSVVVLGDVGGGGRCSFDYSFTRLSIQSGINLYYYTGASLIRVTDVDLGNVLDQIWVDGYFMTTDGTSLVVTELTDSTAVNPLKYGSSEIDPDKIVGLLKLRGEVLALNRYTIETFQNVGGSFFPFQRISGALIQKGIIGKDAKCKVAQTFAFVGSGRNESVSVWLGNGSNAVKIATREIEQTLSKYSEVELSTLIMESREFDAHQHIYIHLPNETLVYDLAAATAMGAPVWFTLSSGVAGQAKYRACNLVYCYGKWIVGDKVDGRIGYLSDSVATQYGDIAGWQFNTSFVYNQSMGGIINSLELVALTGRAELGVNPTIFLSHTKDGLMWSDEKARSSGGRGEYAQRITWRRVTGLFRQYMGFRFRGTNGSVISFARIEAQVEGLNG